MKLPKKWKTVTGSIIAAIGYMTTNLPADMVVGSYHGAAITIQQVGVFVTAIGGALAAIGIGRKIERINK